MLMERPQFRGNRVLDFSAAGQGPAVTSPQPFERTWTAEDRGVPGSGLGLAITHGPAAARAVS